LSVMEYTPPNPKARQEMMALYEEVFGKT
jgi:hypothetical protein